MTDPAQNAIDRRELISFRIGDQEFCVDIMSVREIRGWTVATPLPRTPDFVRGVINLRGAVLPIIDLSARLGLGFTEPEARHVIIVCRINNQMVGLLVDAVSDIVDIQISALRPAPDIAGEGDDILQALVVKGDEVVALLDLPAVVRESHGATLN